MHKMAATYDDDSNRVVDRSSDRVSRNTQSMNVADVRRALSFIRKSWEDQISDRHCRPFYLSDQMRLSSTNLHQSIENFSLVFVLAHHTRRLTKS